MEYIEYGILLYNIVFMHVQCTTFSNNLWADVPIKEIILRINILNVEEKSSFELSWVCELYIYFPLWYQSLDRGIWIGKQEFCIEDKGTKSPAQRRTTKSKLKDFIQKLFLLLQFFSFEDCWLRWTNTGNIGKQFHNQPDRAGKTAPKLWTLNFVRALHAFNTNTVTIRK